GHDRGVPPGQAVGGTAPIISLVMRARIQIGWSHRPWSLLGHLVALGGQRSVLHPMLMDPGDHATSAFTPRSRGTTQLTLAPSRSCRCSGVPSAVTPGNPNHVPCVKPVLVACSN